jgi:hypothetical protein
MALEIIEYIANGLLDVFSMDLDYFESVIPVTSDIVNIIIAVGWALLLGNLVFQAAKSMMSGLGFEGEDPKTLFTRTFVFAFFLLASRQICEMGLGISNTAVTLLQVPSSVSLTLPDEDVFSIGASWLLSIIVGAVLMWQTVKLFFEIGERYFLVGLLTILSPLAFAAGGSKNTGDIFKGWARMYGSMCLMMVLNVIFLKMFISAMGYLPSGPEVVPWLIFMVAIARVARKIDSAVARLGLNPAVTGEGLGSRIPGMLSYMAVRTVVSSITRTAGSAAGRAKAPPGSAPPKTPNTSNAGNRTGVFNHSSANNSSATQNTSNAQASNSASANNSTAQQSKTQNAVRSGSAAVPAADAAPAAIKQASAGLPSGSPAGAGVRGMAGTEQNHSVHQQTKASQTNNNARRSSVTQSGPPRGHTFHPSGSAGMAANSGVSMPGRNSAQPVHPPIPRSQPAGQGVTAGIAGAASQGERAVQRPARFSAVPPGADNPTLRGAAQGMAGTAIGGLGTAPQGESTVQRPARFSAAPPGTDHTVLRGTAPGMAGTAANTPGSTGSPSARQGGTNINAQAQTNLNADQNGSRHEFYGSAGRGAPASRRSEATPAKNAAAQASTAPGFAGTEPRRSAAAPDKTQAARNSAAAPAPNAAGHVHAAAPGGGRDRPTIPETPLSGGNQAARQENGPPRGTETSRISNRPASGAAGRAAAARESGPVRKPELSQNRLPAIGQGTARISGIGNAPKRAKKKNRKGKGGRNEK